MNKNSGGAGVIYRLAQEYEKLGHNVQIFSFDDLPRSWPIQATAASFPLFVSRYLNQSLHRQNIDVIDASTSDGWIWGLTRPKTATPLYVTHSHGLEHILNQALQEEAIEGKIHLSLKYQLYWNGFHLWEVNTSLRQADLSLFLNQQDIDYAINKLGAQPQRARLTANGISEAFLQLPCQKTPVAQNAALDITQIGSYISRKGIDYTTPALKKILQRYPYTRLTFLGTGCPIEQVLADYPTDLHQRITVIPQFDQADLPKLLEGHHIKLFPTLYDGFGVALVEAMACGLAPITTATPGPLSIVKDGYDAIVIPPRDSQAIEQALEKLINDRILLDKLRRNAHATAQNYSWNRIAKERLQLYKEFIQYRNTNGVTM